MSQLSLLYTTFANEEDAFRVSKKLLEMHLVACVNLLRGMKSLYLWDGRLEENHEVVLLLKTTAEKAPLAIQKLEELHPYQAPAILEIPLQYAGGLFLQWIQDLLR